MTDQAAVILQARLGSSRFPGKVCAELAGRPMVAFLIERLRRCSVIDRIVLATTDQPGDDVLADLGETLGLTVVRGSENDVLARFAQAVALTTAPVLIRITGDCPLVDPGLLARAIT
jgi:spore coat polysaccharide biosynthesis protein SpsF (cytidylyltransferase family)